MDITTLAAWGEFLGGIAVIVSLVYLAAQIRSNTRMVRASNFNHLIDKNEEFNVILMDAELTSLWLRGMDDFGGLSSENQIRFTGMISHPFNAAQRAWNLHQQGLVTEQMFQAQTHAMAVHLESDGVKEWWKASQHWWPADFRHFADGMIREGEAAG